MDVPQNRVHARVPFSFEVSLESDNNFYTGLTDNISEGGLFVATTSSPPVGAAVTFELVVGAERFIVAGVVRWVRDRHRASEGSPEGCGIRWTHLPAPAIVAIQRFIRGRETLFYEE